MNGGPSARAQLDPVTVQVLGNYFMSIAEEMGARLIRSSYSSNIKERADCSAALFDRDGNVIAQADHIPMHMGSMLGIVRAIKARYGESGVRPGDMFVTNDPYSGGGTHLPDITVAAPVFYEGELVGFAANIAHHSDVGGRVPGSNSGDSTSIYQEGLRIPLVRLVSEGRLQTEILDFILLNSRLPREREGDIQAQIAANRVGVERLQEACRRYGVATVTGAMVGLLDYAERRIRLAIEKVPDGTYTFTDYMDDDGITDEPIPITVTVRVQGDSIHLDFTGSGRHAGGAINIVRTALEATVYFALKAALDPDIPANGGYHRAIRITAPEGTIVNAVPPAAVAGRTDTAQRIVDTVLGALAQAIPDRIPAACHSAMSAVMFAGFDAEGANYFVYPETIGGGFGARPSKDGMDGVQVHVTNSSNLPVEALELEYPLLIEHYGLIPDSGGPGRWRGGLGIRRDIRILGRDVEFSSHADRQKFAPWGLEGGMPAKAGRFVINPGTPQERRLASGKVSHVRLAPGDVLSAQTPGGGGFGDPLEREPERVAQDVLERKVSVRAAREVYGVVVDAEGRLDLEATARLRQELRGARNQQAGFFPSV
ncbi:hydantoinase B/oxoprolinase family protein [Caldinitratiruptor microaerophilus]|uniref:Methylhydantoinase n=1 Tax=Caldinitratiruptor microaerophilus TaxID=671077 RepID=A0AA35G8S3_9FIRM|nr:hydantoinase B/oxoprolinase family protein [Caldinitratiruptor microaerophilus]BDG59539.1 methylhydantoinase [Caldinitratiruptor microaerophilus]